MDDRVVRRLIAGAGFAEEAVTRAHVPAGAFHFHVDSMELGLGVRVIPIGTYATARTGNAELYSRLMPSRCILAIKVVRGRPSRMAARFGPQTAPPICGRV
jgi:hypothetical protein